MFSTPLLIALVVVGSLALGAATVVARRDAAQTAPRSRTPGRLAPLVPWIGSLLVVVLLVRGALAAAGVVGLATLAHAGVARALASRGPAGPR